jgi:hypothetical protein
MHPFAWCLVLVFAFSASCAVSPRIRARKDESPIGVAEMKADRTIVLRLRAELPDGAVGEGYFVHPPSDPEYQKILDHIGPLSPGQSVPVPPWPEEKDKPNKAPEPTPGSVTLRASSRVIEAKRRDAVCHVARSAPAPVVAHL